MNHLLGNRCAFFVMRGKGKKTCRGEGWLKKKREGQEKTNEEGDFKGDVDTKTFSFF